MPKANVKVKVKVNFTLNGKNISTTVAEDLLVADFFHTPKVNLTGTKVCCGIGVCKACTVAVRPLARPKESLERIQACSTKVTELDQHEVFTVEGLREKSGELHPLQASFLKHFSFQCGYSAPGFLMGAYILMDELAHNPVKKEELSDHIQSELGDHICRCSGYVRYHRAIKEVILKTKGLTV